MVYTITIGYHFSCDMETDIGPIELECASLRPLVNVEFELAAIQVTLCNNSAIELGMNEVSCSHRNLVSSISILEETTVERFRIILAPTSSSQ